MISGLYAQEHPRPGSARSAAAEPPPAPAPTAPPVETTSKTKHSIQINGKTLAYTATAGTLILKKDEQAVGQHVLCRLHARRRAGRRETADYVRLQRRPGIVVGVAAHGSAGTQARGHGSGRRAAQAAVSSGGQRRHRARVHRPGVHRPGDHRFQPRRARRKGHAIPRLRWRSGIGGRIHPALSDARGALAIAEVPGGRKLRHHAIGRAFAIPAGQRRNLFERHHVDFYRAQLRDHLCSRAATIFRTPCSCPATRPPPGITRSFRRICKADLEKAIGESRRFAGNEYTRGADEGRQADGGRADQCGA